MINFDITAMTNDQDTVAEAFADGREAFYAVRLSHVIHHTDQELAAFVLSQVKSCLEPIETRDEIIPGSANYAVGYAAGYVQAYLDEQRA